VISNNVAGAGLGMTSREQMRFGSKVREEMSAHERRPIVIFWTTRSRAPSAGDQDAVAGTLKKKKSRKADTPRERARVAGFESGHLLNHQC
jgi:hypothetical protein